MEVQVYSKVHIATTFSVNVSNFKNKELFSHKKSNMNIRLAEVQCFKVFVQSINNDELQHNLHSFALKS